MANHRLWAPWRLQYIKGDKTGRVHLLLPARHGRRRARLIVHRGERCFVMLNAFPYTNGHVMVAPYEHVADLRELDGEAAAGVDGTRPSARSGGRARLRPRGVQPGRQPRRRGGRRRRGPRAHARRAALEGRHELHAGRRRHAGAARGAAGLVAQAARGVRGGGRRDPGRPRHLQGLRRARASTRTRSTRTSPTASAAAFARVLRDLRGERRRPRACAWRSGTTCASTPPRSPTRFARGLTDEGCDVLDIGMVGTEMVYYAVGSRELDGGVSVTASHNPKQWAGFKLVREGALAAVGRPRHPGRAARGRERGLLRPPTAQGTIERADIYEEFQRYVLGFIDPERDPADADGAGRRQRHGRADDRPADRLASRSTRSGSTSSPTASSRGTSRTRCWRRTAS